MPDPLEQLRSLPPGGRPGLPPEEVRRRGDRMRRRRTTFQAIGAALAVAAVVSGGALVSGNLTGALPQPGPAHSHDVGPGKDDHPPHGWTPEVPAGFRIDDGMPRPGGRNGVREIDDEPGTPWLLDPCQENGAPAQLRWDYLGIRQRTPTGSYGRQLSVYGDARIASEVLASFSRELERCPNYQDYDMPGGGFSEDVWSAEQAGPEIGDESLTLLRRSEQSGLPLSSATHYTAVRVGNAVLLATFDGEFGTARPRQVQRIAREAAGDAASLARRMCVFAVDPCAPPHEDNQALADGPPYLLDASSLRAATGSRAWRTTPDADGEPLLCAEDSTEGLPNDRTDTRYFRLVRDGEVQAKAVATVLGFTLPTDSAASYDKVREWLRTCDDPVDRSHRVIWTGGDRESLHSGRSRFGPTSWRRVVSTAPEACTNCDTTWVNHQGVILAGGRVVLLQVAYLRNPDIAPIGADDLMPRLLEAAGRLAASYS